LEDESLYTINEWYRFQTKQCPAKRNDGDCERCSPLDNDTGYFHRQKKPKLLRFYHAPRSADGSFTEDYYRQQLLLFVPWRDEETDLLSYPEETYQEAYERIIADEDNEHIKEYMEAFRLRAERSCRVNVEEDGDKEKDSAKAIHTFDDITLDDIEEPHASNEGLLLLTLILTLILDQYIFDADKDFPSDLALCNEQQRTIIDDVMKKLADRMFHRDARTGKYRASTDDVACPPPVRQFVSGVSLL